MLAELGGVMGIELLGEAELIVILEVGCLLLFQRGCLPLLLPSGCFLPALASFVGVGAVVAQLALS